MGYSALPIVAVLALDASDFQVSLLSVLAGVVSAVIALPLGPRIEFRRKRPVMIAADLVRFAAVASVPAFALLGWLTYAQLCVVAIIRVAGTMAFNAAGGAHLKAIVPAGHRAEANSRFETTLWTVNTVGPPVGGVLISWLGATASMVADALSFLVSAVGIGRLRTPEPPPPVRNADHHWAREITDGWRSIFRHPGLRALFLNSLVFGGGLMAAVPLLTVFMLRDLGFSTWEYGLAFGVPSLAGVLGSLLVPRIVKRAGLHRLLLFAGVGRNLWLILIPFAPGSTAGLILIIVAELLLTLFAGLFNPAFATYRMNATPDRYLARVLTAWSISTKVAQPVCVAAAGLFATVTSPKAALIGTGLVLLGATLLLPWREPVTPRADE